MKGAKTTQDLTEYEFNTLKDMGFLWEFFPDAPASFQEIKKTNKSDLEKFFDEYQANYISPKTYIKWLNHYFFDNKFTVFGNFKTDDAEKLMFSALYQFHETILTIDCLFSFISDKTFTSINAVINKQKQLMIEKDRQYGNAVLNPKLFFIEENEIGTVIKGLINNKLNRLIHQTDNEDAVADLLGYMIFLYIYEESKSNEKTVNL